MAIAVKSMKRIEIVQKLMEQLKTPEVFKVANYKSQSEDKIKTQQYPHILNEVSKLYQDYHGMKPDNAKKKAKLTLLWEGNKNTTVNNTLFLGTFHRPDLVLEFEEGLRIAIEIKRGETGAAIREGVGQAVIYTSSGAYDFTVLLFIDTSKEGKIVHSINGEHEKKFIEKIWLDNNVLFGVI